MIRKAHETQGIGDRRVGREVSEPRPGESEGLAHGAGHDEPLSPLEQAQRRRQPRRGELGVGLVDDDDAIGRVVGGGDGLKSHRGARRVVRGTEEHNVGIRLRDPVDRGLGRYLERVIPLSRYPSRAGTRGDDGVHRIGGRKAENASTRTSEGLEHLLEHLVRPVCGPNGIAGEPGTEVPGEALAKLGEFAIGIPVDPEHRCGEGRHNIGGNRFGDRMGVLVHVEADADLFLRCAVRGEPTKVVTKGQIVEGDHLSMLEGPASARVLLRNGETLARLDDRTGQLVELHDVGDDIARVGRRGDLFGHLP